MLVYITQFFIFIFSASAIWFVGRTEKWSKYGYVLGLLSQPFWFYSTITQKQYGMLCLTIFYTYSWGQGFYNHFIKKKPTDINEKVNEIYTDTHLFMD
jgi:hypothetical protein